MQTGTKSNQSELRMARGALAGINTLLYYGKLLCIRAATMYRDCRYHRRIQINNTQIAVRLFLHNLVCILHSIFYTKST